jgi:hypothetical protein
MKAIREIVATDKLHGVIDIPPTFGNEVEVIVLPIEAQSHSQKRPVRRLNKEESQSPMVMEERSGYLCALLGDPDEDVWNDL